jgi:drug/metabolite transporter (DMT)-like permease
VSATRGERVWLGVACAAAAYGLFAVQSLAAKLLAAQGFHPVELGFWRCALSLIPLALWMVRARRWDLLRIIKPRLLTFRVLIGITNLWFLFAAMALLPMADATIVIMSNVLLAPLLAIVFLGERVGWHRWTAIVAGFGGVVLAAGPAWAMSPAGLACGLVCAALMAGVKVSLRGLRDSPPLGTAFWFLAGGTVLSAMALPWTYTALPSASTAPLFLLIGASGLVGQILICFAFARAPASLIAPWDYTGLIWATAFDVVLWGAVPGWPFFSGAGVIATAHLYILHRERRRA